ncbi:PhzF family phenazine biosynthesis isomerase [candidate division KSB1 bacterium]|nr:PhzF family phenazine biosynthesis isomerase [candidate division KSB1 bacterium]
MKLPIYQVDAFTSELFSGNPAAVCPLKEWLPDEKMQKIAAENNLAETAFFVPKGKIFELRWFTPKVEVDLCGHATLASAYVIFNYLKYFQSQIEFSTKSGALYVFRDGDLLILNFPATKPALINAHDDLIAGLNRTPLETYKSRDIMAVFEKEEDIINLKPDFKILKNLDCLGIIATAPGAGSDFVSRFFAPRVGVDEDPVTGSAHTTLIPFWAERLGKNKLHAFQLSRRRGEIFCEFLGDRVNIGGRAVTFFIGEMML